MVWMLTDVVTPKQSEDIAPTLGSRDYKSPPHLVIWEEDRETAVDVVPTLRTQTHGHEPIVMMEEKDETEHLP